MSSRWDESEHPRDGRGRFADKRGDWASAASDQIAGRRYPRVEGSDLVADGWVDQHQAEFDGALEDWKAAGYPFGDPIIGRIASKHGFDGKPAVGTNQELDAAIAEGGLELWRGYNKWIDRRTTDFVDIEQVRRAQTEWREGEYKAGNGIYGQGVYTSVNSWTGSAYSFGHDWNGDSGVLKWTTQRMVLSPEARVIDWDDPALGALPQFKFDASDNWDRGRMAAALGYDAMRIPEGNDDGSGEDDVQYVIFNRTALLVEQERRDDFYETH